MKFSFVIISRLIHIHTMPTRTNRQLASDAVHRAFLINFVADLEQRELDFDSDSEDSDDMDVDSSEIEALI